MKGFGQGGDQEPNNHSNRTHETLCRDCGIWHKDDHLIRTQSGLYDTVSERKKILSKRHVTALLEFDKLFKGLWKYEEKIIWSGNAKYTEKSWKSA